ncbi:hypothetical protein IKG_06127 [Bacillus cereus VD200]|nr:hypothetical protein IKG_06127 [Bacillus cereus VD200]
MYKGFDLVGLALAVVMAFHVGSEYLNRINFQD